MNPDIRAACVGQSSLFDSTEPADHRVAKQICLRDCPMLNACRQELRAAQQAEAGSGASGGPRGTWAGQLMGHNRKRDQPVPGLPREVREARAAYARGDRTDWATAGNRAYERARRALREAS